MNSNIPEPVARYFAADHAGDVDMLDECFAPDAIVKDESKQHEGIEAIKSWQAAAKAEYEYTSELLECQAEGDKAYARAKVTGTFPGSPIELGYTFALAGGRISALTIE
jgi:ketosteroid isomerase-like protein